MRRRPSIEPHATAELAARVALALLIAPAIGCTDRPASLPPSLPLAPVATAQLADPTTAPPLACERPACASDTTLEACFDGRWPGGVVHYRFAAGELGWARRAMDDWETLTHHVIRFEPTTKPHDPPSFPVITLFGDGGGHSSGYAGCINPRHRCEIHFSKSNVYHELGHTIATSSHVFSRYDRRHYVSLHFGGESIDRCTARSFARCASAELGWASDLGPFDYRSTMMYTPTHPDIARFDGSPIVPGTACGKGSFTSGREPNARITPTCTECRVKQPNGFPTPNDASAVVESYRNLADPGWKKLVRTVDEDLGEGRNRPFDYALARGVTIPASASPAVESEQPGALSLYVRGSDDHLYTKQRASSAWSSWVDLGAPDARGPLSDPAVVSMSPGRSDLVVRRGDAVHLRTRSRATWGPWSSLGAPPSPASSAPSITSSGPDRLDVFVRGADAQLYRTRCTARCSGASGTWTAWSAIPGEPFQGRPSAIARKVSAARAIVSVFVHRLDDRLGVLTIDSAIASSDDAIEGWQILPSDVALASDPRCPDCASPAAGARGDGSLEVFVRGADDMLWIARWTRADGWSPRFLPLGGVLRSSPGVVAQMRPDQRQTIAVLMAEETTFDHLEHGVWVKQYAP